MNYGTYYETEVVMVTEVTEVETVSSSDDDDGECVEYYEYEEEVYEYEEEVYEIYVEEDCYDRRPAAIQNRPAGANRPTIKANPVGKARATANGPNRPAVKGKNVQQVQGAAAGGNRGKGNKTRAGPVRGGNKRAPTTAPNRGREPAREARPRQRASPSTRQRRDSSSCSCCCRIL